ncbi:hypothetical protein [Acuticoccus sp.]|uniref:hypothetical protein n=1 Tax=Acuticoccus sp. TaxID=1904378 RepID=UPI003B51E66C
MSVALPRQSCETGVKPVAGSADAIDAIDAARSLKGVGSGDKLDLEGWIGGRTRGASVRTRMGRRQRLGSQPSMAALNDG